MDIQKEREAFEDWYCKNHTGLKQSDLAKFRTPSGYFFSDPLKIDVSWEAWQEAKAQSEKALLEQFEINNKLVEQIEKLKADAPGQITITHERLQELIAIGVKAALEEQK